MGIMKEFRDFMQRGNIVDLAIGIIIGTVFAALVGSLVADIIMPPVGRAVGGIDFAELFVILEEGSPPPPYTTLDAAREAGAVTINYGLFINALVTFLIVGLIAFFIVRTVNRLKRPEAPQAPPPTATCPFCLESIPLKASRCRHCTSYVKETPA